jgi:hypothetical protein
MREIRPLISLNEGDKTPYLPHEGDKTPLSPSPEAYLPRLRLISLIENPFPICIFYVNKSRI